MGFYISISNGLLENDHQKRMGPAVWQFMWLIDKVTKIDEDGTGWVLGGKPIHLQDLANSVTEDTVSRNLQRLELEGYIVINHAPYGLIIKVLKTKKRFGKNVEPTSAKMPGGVGKNVEPPSIQFRGQDNKTVKAKFFSNPLMNKIQETYPDRNYDFQFDLMIDWYISKKRKLPQNISAFSNWLKFTKPDELIQGERRRKIEKEDLDRRQKMLSETPRASEEKVQAMRDKMKGIIKSI